MMQIFPRRPSRPLLLAALAFSLATGSGAAQDIMSGANQCYGTSQDRKAGEVRNVRALYRRSDSDQPGQDVFVGFNFSLWDVPNETHGITANCAREGEQIVCAIECDGGRLRLKQGKNGQLLAEASGLRVDALQATESLLPQVMGADGGVLNDIFVLDPLPAENGTCDAEPQRTFVELREGDLSPRVRILEAKLGQLGHLLEFPDTVFDETTTLSVISFQEQYNLPVTGVVDQRTAEAIESIAATSAGGC